MKKQSRRPDWLRIRTSGSFNQNTVSKIVSAHGLHTVCNSAQCPNRAECFQRGTATFLVMGNTCTRNCTFCAVNKGEPEPLDPTEPGEIASAVRELGLKHAVITSVTRDDLTDGGAAHFVSMVTAMRKRNQHVTIEILVPDFAGNEEALKTVLDSSPDILNHNIETIARLYPEVRPMASYERSLKLLELSKTFRADIFTKSGLMLGLGETFDEVVALLRDLREVDCDFLTIGQYLSPSAKHHPVCRYAEPSEFDRLRNLALELGFREAFCAPMVRSSFHAGELFQNIKEK